MVKVDIFDPEGSNGPSHMVLKRTCQIVFLLCKTSATKIFVIQKKQLLEEEKAQTNDSPVHET